MRLTCWSPLHRSLLLSSLVVLLTPALPAAGQMLPVTLPRSVGQENPPLGATIVPLPGGEAMALWWTPGPTLDGPVRGQRFDVMGRPQGEELEIVEHAQSFDAAATGDGRVLIVWNQAHGDGSISGRYFQSVGDALGPVFQVSELSSSARLEPAVDCHSDASCIVVWSSSSFPIPGAEVLGRRIAADGTLAIRELVLYSTSLTGLRQARVALEDEGGFALTWLATFTVIVAGPGGPVVVSVAEPYLYLYGPDDTPASPALLLDDSQPPPSPIPNEAHSTSRVAADWNEDLEVVAVWDRDFGGRREVRARRFTGGGDSLGEIQSLGSGRASGPDLAWMPALNHFAVTWLAGEGTEPHGVRLRVLGPDGDPAGFEMPAVEYPAGRGPVEPVLAPDGGGLWAAWLRYPASSGGAEPAVEVQRWAAGEPLCIPPILPPGGGFWCTELMGGRFLAYGLFRLLENGGSAFAGAGNLTGQAGSFTFYNPQNPEVIAKMVDGRALNDSYWFFYGALSNQEYAISVYDRETGLTRVYYNPPGTLASSGDTGAFPTAGLGVLGERAGQILEGLAFPAATIAEKAALFPCVATPTSLCLQGERFAASLAWRDFAGNGYQARAVGITDDGGYFYFFNPENVEVAMKVLDGGPVNGHFWVFYASLTNVEFDLTVVDYGDPAHPAQTYHNPSHTFASVADTGAFPNP